MRRLKNCMMGVSTVTCPGVEMKKKQTAKLQLVGFLCPKKGLVPISVVQALGHSLERILT